jgi:hypothetical protein
VQGPGEIRKPLAPLEIAHLDRRAQLHQVVDEVPGEAVVVVDDEDHGVPLAAR